MPRTIWLERLVVGLAALVTVWGIGSFGLWDPWELTSNPITERSIALFGPSEWSARLPGLLASVATGALAYLLVRERVSGSAAVVAVAVLASTPAFLLNARLAMGDAVGTAAQAWVGAAAIVLASSPARTTRSRLAAAALVVGALASASANGVMLGPLPPLAAVAALLWISEEDRTVSPLVRWSLPLLTVALALGVAHAVTLDSPEASAWLGGGAVGGEPPTWDKAFVLVFHSFAPWSAALPVAAAWALRARPSLRAETRQLAWALLLWIALAIVSWTIFASRYGTPPFLAALPVAALIACWLDDALGSTSAAWPAAVVVALLTGILIRDYALYPDIALAALAVDGPSVPEVAGHGRSWAAAFAVAGIGICVALVSPPSVERPDGRRITAWLRARWNGGGAPRAWLLVALSLVGACTVFGLMCFVLDLRIASVVVRTGRIAFFAPLLLAALVFGLPWLRYAASRLQRARVFLALVAGLGVGAYVTFSLIPALSQHFSPRPVYEAYASLGGTDEPLASYRASSEAAAYYTDAAVQTIETQEMLLEFLAREGQRWVIVPSGALATLDRAYRRRSGSHLYVADGESARLVLVAAEPIDGRPNRSFLETTVLDAPPPIQHRTSARFDGRIELLGYDLDLPDGESVGAGRRFSITWYWRVLKKPPAGYQVFVHIDGRGLRINGDHEPVQGRYPTKLWDEGDVIVDRHELFVPANFRSDDYTIYAGWFSGSKRLPVEAGDQDGEDRVRAGVLSVR